MAIDGTTNSNKSNRYDRFHRQPSIHELRCACSSYEMRTAMQECANRSARLDRVGTYLGRNELRELTGTPMRTRQILWLATQGWPHVIDVHGRVLVARAYHDKQMGIIESQTSRSPSKRMAQQLNLGAV
jgi:hypothetical protein